jgi:hypothetical protein
LISGRLIVERASRASMRRVFHKGRACLITFVYLPYEIASYADGQIELMLPWESLDRYLWDDTAVALLAR